MSGMDWVELGWKKKGVVIGGGRGQRGWRMGLRVGL